MDKRHKKHNKKNNKSAATGTANGTNAPDLSKKPILSIQKRNELRSLVVNLLKLGMQQANNANEQWTQYVEIQKNLERVQVLEAPLKIKNAKSSRMANIDAFYEWASKNGVQYDGIKISEFPGFDLGLEATRNFQKNDPLITIPRKLIISEEDLPDGGSPAEFGVLTSLKLAYVLILEKLKPDSFWKPYIDLLPEKYNTVLYYSVEDMQELKGSNELAQALKLCKTIARQYAFIYNCYQAPTPPEQISPIGKCLKEKFSYDLYR